MSSLLRKFPVLFLIISFISIHISGQVSQGGRPLEISGLKSASLHAIEMPAVNNQQLLYDAKINNQNHLKPFRFAHTFNVNISPKNSGEWVVLENGTRVWRCKIRSEKAKSINLIFEKFNLPNNARLFIYNEKEDFYLGAYTSANNKKSGKFAVSPVLGDEVVVQYEVENSNEFPADFEITRVNHDFVGILKYNDRRPLGKAAGSCNVDINCESGSDWKEIKNAVCRLIVNGREICSGTLINNTAEDQTPYVLSAGHCYDSIQFAETTVYTFNYESPYCAPLDGDPSHSVSGAVLRSTYEKLDFALAEMSMVPPPDYRPYFAGWDRSANIPDSTVSIHHPQGDIKKIAFDFDAPQIATYSPYEKNAFLKIINWEDGVTEAGSSGGGLFNYDGNLIGTLTGGLATCSNPISDYFARFAIYWDLRPDSAEQLKYWLDPVNTGIEKLNGKQFNTNENLCMAFTHLSDADVHQLIKVQAAQFSGYRGGTNTVGATEFVERFSIYGNEQLAGVSLGVGKNRNSFGSTNNQITVKVYNGSTAPETLIYSKVVGTKSLEENAMNFIGFDQTVEPADTFFVGFELSNIHQRDSFVIFQSLRDPVKENFVYIKQNGLWSSFKDLNTAHSSAVNVMELVACNVDFNTNDTPLVNNPAEILIYPNPSNDIFTLETGEELLPENISVYDLMGKQVAVVFSNQQKQKIQINLAGNVPGVYFIRYKTQKAFVTQKVSFVPW